MDLGHTHNTRDRKLFYGDVASAWQQLQVRARGPPESVRDNVIECRADALPAVGSVCRSRSRRTQPLNRSGRRNAPRCWDACTEAPTTLIEQSDISTGTPSRSWNEGRSAG